MAFIALMDCIAVWQFLYYCNTGMYYCLVSIVLLVFITVCQLLYNCSVLLCVDIVELLVCITVC